MSDMDVYVYPNAQRHDERADVAKQGLESTLEEIVANSEMESFNVEIRREYPNITGGRLSTKLRNWRRELPRDAGSHLLITDATEGGAAGIASGAGRAWTAPSAAAMSTIEVDFFKAGCSQEVLHNYVNSSLRGVQELANRRDYEHSLGIVDDEAQSSPMVSGYTEQLAGLGECSNDVTQEKVRQSPSQCTIQACELSWENATGGDGPDDPDDPEDPDEPEPEEPEAVITASTENPEVGDTVELTAGESSSPNGSIVEAQWNATPGGQLTADPEEQVPLQRDRAVEVEVELTVVDEADQTATTSQTFSFTSGFF